MQTRKQLFKAGGGAASANMIPATVKFVHDKRAGKINPLKPHEKMLCALRKALAAMSNDDETGRRFFIMNNQVELLQAPQTTDGKVGGPQTYRASGRCKLGMAHPDGHMTSMIAAFTITFRDAVDDRGLADIKYIEPTTIDAIDGSDPANVSHLK